MWSLDYRLLESVKTAYGGDAIFRPSSIDRVINCPGSIVLVARSTAAVTAKRSTRWSLEGSAMHAWAEKLLRNEADQDDWEDFTYTQDGQTVRLTEAMADGAADYVNTVSEHWRPGVIQHVEQKLSLAKLNPRDPLLAENAGTTDCVQLDYDQQEIRIFDLKGGQGVMVDPRSPQLKNYALMALVTYPAPKEGWLRVRLHVSQPRAKLEEERSKWVEFKVTELTQDFAAELVGAMRRSLDIDAPLKPGSWCHWCPAKQTMTCPALQDNVFGALDTTWQPPDRNANSLLGPLPTGVFVGTEAEPEPMTRDSTTVVLRPLSSLSANDTALLLKWGAMFVNYYKAAQHYAAALIQHGTKVPGWKLAYRTGRRKWIASRPEVEEYLLGEGLQVAQIYTERKIKSVHQVELQLKKLRKGVPKELYETPQGSVLLVPADSDKAEISALLGPIEQDDDTDDDYDTHNDIY